MAIINERKSIEALPIEELDHRDEIEESRGELAEQLMAVLLKNHPSQNVQIEALLPFDLHDKLDTFLWKNSNIFAWSAS